MFLKRNKNVNDKTQQDYVDRMIADDNFTVEMSHKVVAKKTKQDIPTNKGEVGDIATLQEDGTTKWTKSTGNIEDVQVDGISVVLNKIANIDLKNYKFKDEESGDELTVGEIISVLYTIFDLISSFHKSESLPNVLHISTTNSTLYHGENIENLNVTVSSNRNDIQPYFVFKTTADNNKTLNINFSYENIIGEPITEWKHNTQYEVSYLGTTIIMQEVKQRI